jgi:tRNA pseudouridine synthase 9
VIPSTSREAPAPPTHLQALTEAQGSPESLGNTANSTPGEIADKRLPRETGEDIGMGSPVPLSSEAVGIITRLRNMKVNLRFHWI